MSDKKNLQDAYNQIAQEFSATRAYPWQELSVFIPYLKNGGKVLDLGCGNGRLIKVLEDSQMPYEYLGVDFSEQLIQAAKKNHPKHNFVVADMRDLDYPEASFDFVFLVAAFHHLETKADRQAMLDNIYYWLKPNGYLFMTNWNLLQKKYLKCFFKNIFEKKSWNDVFVPYKLPNSNRRYERYYHSFTVGELEGLLQVANFSLQPKGVYKTRFNINCLVKKT